MEEIQIQVEEEPITIAGGAVDSVNGQTGDVVLTAQDVGALSDSTVIPTKTSDLENDSDYQTGDEVNQAIGLETTARENADIGLQGQIDALSAASDVTDIVGTYADLQAYDTSKLKDNDIIKVLQDENENDETTYYRWSKSTESFTLIGEEGPYYTKAAADQKFQDKLTAGSNITIDANNEISASGIPTTATFWGASYDSVNNRVNDAINFVSSSDYTLWARVYGSSSKMRYDAPAGTNHEFYIGGTKKMSIYGNYIDCRDSRVINVGEPTSTHDAATKNYVDTQVGNIETILQSINSGQGV